MPRYRVEETQSQLVTHFYEVDAPSPEAAVDKVRPGNIDHYDVEFGDYYGAREFMAIPIEHGPLTEDQIPPPIPVRELLHAAKRAFYFIREEHGDGPTLGALHDAIRKADPEFDKFSGE